jgi:hypothetical protein
MLTGERVSEAVDIDNTPPVVRAVATPQVVGDEIKVVFLAEDATGKIRKADASVDGGPWNPMFPDDGIADSGREQYSTSFRVTTQGEHTISLRVFDSSGNVGTLSVTARK